MLSKKLIGILLVASLVISSTSMFLGNTFKIEMTDAGYTSFGSITISNDTDLLSKASANGWAGTGSETSPIIIEGYMISTNPALSITGTTLYVVIRNMMFQDANIIINTSANIGFESIEFRNSGGFGIDVDNSSNLSFRNLNSTGSVDLFEVNGVSLNDSVITDTKGTTHGINAINVQNLLISNITLNDVPLSGVYLSESSNVSIFDINVSSTGNNGITVISTTGVSIRGLTTNGSIAQNDVYLKNTNQTEVDGILSLLPQGASIVEATGTNNTIIQNVQVNSSFGAVYLVNSTNIVLKDSVINSTQTHGVRVHLVDGFNLTNVAVNKSGLSGIYVSNSTEGSVSQAYSMNSNQTGILFDFTTSTQIEESVTEKNLHYGVLVRLSSDSIISNVTSIDNGINGSLFSGIGSDASDNITISNNVAKRNKYSGILVSGSNITVKENDVSDNYYYGITGNGLDHLVVRNNIVKNNTKHGMFLVNANNQNYSDNNVYGNGGHGIHLSIGENTTVANNMITNSGMHGLFVNGMKYAKLTENIVKNSSNKGIVITLGTNVTAKYNSMVESLEEGMYVDSGSNISVLLNNMIDNRGLGVAVVGISSNIAIMSNNFVYNGIPQGLDNTTGVTWEGNYWSDLVSPDEDQDGVVDIPYVISGTANVTDPKPMASVTEGFDHYDYMLDLVLVTPKAGKTLNGTIYISWLPAIVGMNLSVIYSLYSSDNGGKSWLTIATDITSTSYNWSTYSLANGSHQIKLTAKAGLRQKEVISGAIDLINIHRLTGLDIISPTNGVVVSGKVIIEWTQVHDTFPHIISYSVEYSMDGSNWITIVQNYPKMSIVWDSTALQNVSIMLRITASDGQGASLFITISLIVDNVVSNTITTTTSTFQTPAPSQSGNIVVLFLVLGSVSIVAVGAFMSRARIVKFVRKYRS